MHPLNSVTRAALTIGLTAAGITAATTGGTPDVAAPTTPHPATVLAPPIIEDRRGFGPMIWIQTAEPILGDDTEQSITVKVPARSWTAGSAASGPSVSLRSRGGWCTRFQLRGGRSIPRGSSPFVVEVTVRASDGFTQRVLARAQSETSSGAATGGVPRVNSGCRRGILGSPG